MDRNLLLFKIKNTLRITDDTFDDELLDLIDEALQDLDTSCVNHEQYEALVYGAVKAYVRAHFEIDSDTSDKILRVYESKKNKLSILGGE